MNEGKNIFEILNYRRADKSILSINRYPEVYVKGMTMNMLELYEKKKCWNIWYFRSIIVMSVSFANI